MGKFMKGLIVYLVIALTITFIVGTFMQPLERPHKLTYTEFMENVEAGKVRSVTIVGDRSITGVMDNGRKFETYSPDPYLTDKLLQKGIIIDAKPEPSPSFVTILLPQLITTVLFIGVWLFLLNQMQGGNNRAMSFGKSKAKLYTEDKPRVTFDDVAGLDEAKEELNEVVEFLKNPRKFVQLGAKIPKGVLLVGYPGTGKTLLARAIAGEAGVPFFSISGSDFVEMFVGVGAARVRDLFEQAKKNAPCIVFIDEIDAVGRQRGAGLGGGHDEREQTLNQMLVEMDGFQPNMGIILLAATNRPDVLDPALLRPGRFDRQIVVSAPDIKGREEILKVHSKGKPLAGDVDLNVLARRTPGFTGADLANVMNEAALLAARREKTNISMAECEEAIERVMVGPERKSRIMTDGDKRLTAYHEAGHAVVARFLSEADPVHKITIIPRGMAGGVTISIPENDKYYRRKTELLHRISMALGGRVAEEIVLGEISSGAQSDIYQATKIAHSMVCEWGMSEKLGPLSYGRSPEEAVFLGRDLTRDKNYSEEVAAEIDNEIRAIVNGCYDKAKEILTEKRAILDAVAQALIEKETLGSNEFEELVQKFENPDNQQVIGEDTCRDNPPKTKANEEAISAVRKASDGPLIGGMVPES